MKHFTNAWKQEMTPRQVAQWFKQQSDEQIAVLEAHGVWYGPEHERPEPSGPAEPQIDEPTPEPDPEPVLVLHPDMSKPERIIALCAYSQKVHVRDVRAKFRRAATVRARQAAAYLMRHHCKYADGTPMSTPQIGDSLGGRNHSTVLHAIRQVTEDLDTGGKVFGDIIAHVERELGVA